ncbi:hypothetical protein OROGR_025314 [Orobanche gracilis]
MGGPKRRLKKVDAGSILTTLFAVSCFASMEDIVSKFDDFKLLEAAIESKTAYVDIADHEGFSRRAKSYKNKAIAAGVPAITNAGANPGVSSLMAATLIHNVQHESKGQPERLRYHYFTAGSGGNGPGVLATSFYLIADEVVTYYKGAKMMLKPYIDKLSIEFGEGIGNKDVFLMLMAATLIHNAQRESKGQPKRLRYHYFTTGSGGNGPGVLATSFYLIADEVVTYYKGAKMMKPYSDKLSLEKGSATRMFF